MRAVAVLLLAVAAAPGRPGSSAEDATERRRDAIARELVGVGNALRREIVARDVEALLARVPREGLRCGDRVIPRAKVARDLRSPSSWVHGSIFGAPGMRAGDGAPGSVAALLRSARNVAIVVSFQRGPAAGPEGLPCVDFRAKGVVTPGVPFCFEKRGGRWWLTDSLYPCG